MHRLILAALLLVGACDSGTPAAAPPAASGAPAPAKVELGTVAAGTIEDKWSFLGQVEPLQSAQLAPAVDGQVVRVEVREGDRVRSGQPLVVLDAATARAELDASRAREAQLTVELEQATRDAERVRKLTGAALSEPEKERIETRVKTLSAQVAAQKAESDRAQTIVGRHTLRAPFAGVIRTRSVDPGAWVSSGATVLELLSLDELEVLVEVSQALAPHVAPGGAATLRSQGGDGEAKAEIVGVVAALDPSTRTMRVRLRPTESPGWLLAGMAVSVEFPVSLAGRGVTVSRDALVRGAVDVRVIKAEGGAAKSIPVEVIATTNDRALVEAADLAPGDRVVIRGNERLRPGQALEVPR